MEPQNTAILIFNGVQIIDYTGPFEALGQAGDGRRRFYKPFTVSQSTDPILTNMQMKVIPTYDFESCPKVDILVLPGGGVEQHLENETIMEWVRKTAESAEYVLSVCNGAFFLGKAGLLDGLSATTTAGLHARLKELAPTTNIVYEERFVDNGKIITTAGLSSGIDGALHLIAKQHSPGWAMQAAISMEYDWRPKSDYTRVMLADMQIPGPLYQAFMLPDGDLLEAEGNRSYWLEKWQVPSDKNAAELQQTLDDWISAETNWQRVNGGWRFQGSNGTDWESSLTISPVADQQLLFDITINRVGRE